MNRLRTVSGATAIAVVAAVLGASCGGAATPAGSGRASTGPSSSASAPPTTGETSGSTQTAAGGDDLTLTGFTTTSQMRAYFRQVARVRRQLVITRRSTRALKVAIQAGDGTAAGAAAHRAAAGVRRALTIAKRITPGEPLGTIHSALLANLRLGAAYLTRMANDIESQNMARIRRWPKTVLPTIRRSEQWYAEWAANSASFAKSLGLRAPHWLRTMDRWN